MSTSDPQLDLFHPNRFEGAPRDSEQVLLGASSWTGEGWVGSFYPAGCRSADFLPFYAANFGTVEIDSTFYRTPSANTVKQWKQRTPDGFLFAAKAPQVITHEKTLIGADSEIRGFLSVMDLLGDRLGPILLQFPYFNRQRFPNVECFLERLEPFLDRLPAERQWAVEIRNKNWLGEKLYSALRQRGMALALVDHAWMPRPHEYFEAGDPVTANFSYIRWIGDRKGIEQQTTRWDRVILNREREMEEWMRVVQQLIQRRGRIFGYFNNHWQGHAPGSIKLFQALFQKSRTEIAGANPA